MSEVQFFASDIIPEFTTPEWYAGRDRAPHLEQPEHRPRMERAAWFVAEAVHAFACASVSDMGAGDGGLLSRVEAMCPCARYWGYDLMPANVAGAAERGVPVELADFQSDPVRWGDCAVFAEVLEHLIDPHAVLRGCPSRCVVASSPCGETADSHYEFHCWGWDMDGYRAMFEQAGFQMVRHETVGGFQVVLAVRPREAL